VQLVSDKTVLKRQGVGLENQEAALVGKDLVGQADIFRTLPMVAFSLSSLLGGIGVLAATVGASTLVGLVRAARLERRHATVPAHVFLCTVDRLRRAPRWSS